MGYGLKNTLNSEGTEKKRWRKERLVNTSQEKEKRERVFDNSMKLFGAWNALCEFSIYRENSQLISEKLWKQVIHILDLVQKNISIESQNILYWVQKYIILCTKIYFRSSTKIY